MDDMKRAIYMSALEKISREKAPCICIALKIAVAEVLGCLHHEISDGLLEELLPEFFQLFDGVAWYKLEAYDDLISSYVQKDKMHIAPWWKYGWKTPRIRILNYILREDIEKCQH